MSCILHKNDTDKARIAVNCSAVLLDLRWRGARLNSRQALSQGHCGQVVHTLTCLCYQAV